MLLGNALHKHNPNTPAMSTWTHANHTFCNSLNRRAAFGVGVHCDFAHLVDASRKQSETITVDGESVANVNLEIQRTRLDRRAKYIGDDKNLYHSHGFVVYVESMR